MTVFEELFKVKKPLLGMVHFPPLPGSPLYDAGAGMRKIRDTALRDAETLVKAGFDGIVFSNEGDRPYLSKVDNVTVAAMSRVISETSATFDVPFGLSVLADPEAAVAIGAAVEANFVRIFLSWVFVGDWGIVDPDAGKIQRLKSSLSGNMKVFANISGHTEPLGGRKLEDIARGAVKFGLADAVCLAGTTAGSEIAEDDLRAARRGAGDAPVIAGTGVSVENAERMLSLADGVIMGTSIKFGRDTFKPVDPEKAAEFIRRTKDIRDRLQ